MIEGKINNWLEPKWINYVYVSCAAINLRRTIWVPDLHLFARTDCLALSCFIDGLNSEIIFSILDEVWHVEDVGRWRYRIDLDPIIWTGLFPFNQVAQYATPSIICWFVPSEGDKVWANLFHLWLTRGSWRICSSKWENIISDQGMELCKIWKHHTNTEMKLTLTVITTEDRSWKKRSVISVINNFVLHYLYFMN